MAARRLTFVVVLVLLGYVLVGAVWLAAESFRIVLPTPTRTPKPTYTAVSGQGVLLRIATATATPSRTATSPPMATTRATATPLRTAAPTALPTLQPVQHVVRAGDTIWGIAVQYGVDYRALLATNDLSDADVLALGQVLLVPPGESDSGLGRKTHRVQAGETILAIAAEYGVNTAAILRANGISDPDLIYAGQDLVIPPE